ncbi:hypothetical protein SteCoe_36808 [Stentor coeruleus]|uniref:Kelch motif family protein n=1 Tax=Stentor coeruleus TaxID=5963 RepID=A0A1R2APN6_9CILI|nr:hypothetical protein SteCoe_36808 [Stentor coeruleus]
MYNNFTNEELRIFKSFMEKAQSLNLNLNDVISSIQPFQPQFFFSINAYRLPSSTDKSSCVLLENQDIIILSFSGSLYKINIYTSELQTYSIQSRPCRWDYTWSKIPEKVIIYGGRDKQAGKIFSDLLIFDLIDHEWIDLEAQFVPEPRFNSSSCTFVDFFLIFGGVNQKGRLRDCHVLDLNSIIWTEVETQMYISKGQDTCKICSFGPNAVFFSAIADRQGYVNDVFMAKFENFKAKMTNLNTLNKVYIEKVVGIEGFENNMAILGKNQGNYCVCLFNVVTGNGEMLEYVENFNFEYKEGRVIQIPFFKKGKAMLCSVFYKIRVI